MDPKTFGNPKNTSRIAQAKTRQIEDACSKGKIKDCFDRRRRHLCSSNCLIVNPNYSEIVNIVRKKKIPFLSVATVLGWQRYSVEIESTSLKTEMYLSPCQKSIRNFNELHGYLLQTGCNLPINFFSFKNDVNIRNVFVSDNEVVIKDITEGKELLPISVVNAYDRSTDALAKKYISDFTYDQNVKKNHDSNFLVCCDCPNDCMDKLQCPCFQLTLQNCDPQTKSKYNFNDIGYSNKLLKNTLLSGIFECNRMCKCRQSCMNRVVQHEAMFQLQIFKTFNKGWGVRTLHDIPEGSFVCNYVGKIKTEQKASKMNVNEEGWKYMADLHVALPFKDGYEEEVIEPEPAETESPNTPDSPDSGIFTSPVSCEKELFSPVTKRKKYQGSKPNMSECQIEDTPTTRCTLITRDKHHDASLSYNQGTISERDTVTNWMNIVLDSPSTNFPESSSQKTNIPPRLADFLKESTKSKNISLDELHKHFNELTNNPCFSPISAMKRFKASLKHSVSIPSKGICGMYSNGVPVKNYQLLKSTGKYCLRSRRRKKVARKPNEVSIRRKNNSLMKIGKFVADAKIEGNVARYINHSCEPNIVPQLVFTESQDLNFPQLALFAIKNIKAGTEITWDYNYEIEDETTTPKMPCYCGTKTCRGRLF